MTDFSECLHKIDKWAAEDFEVQDQFYEIVENENATFEEKVDEMQDFLEILVRDWERLESYLDGEYSDKELAKELVKNYS